MDRQKSDHVGKAQSAKRQSVPGVLTADEIRALLSELNGPY